MKSSEEKWFYCSNQLFVTVCVLVYVLYSSARSCICFFRFIFASFLPFQLDALRWTDTCILVSFCVEVPCKGDLLKTDSRESRVLFSVHSTSYFPHFPYISVLQRLVLFPLPRNESYIRFFRSSYPHFYREFPLLSLFFSQSRVFVLFSRVTLFNFLPSFSHSCLRISYPHPSSLSPWVAVELNRAQQPVLRTKKGYHRCLPCPFPFFFHSISTFSFSLPIRRFCAVLWRRNVAAAPAGEAPFLIFPGTIVSAW